MSLSDSRTLQTDMPAVVSNYIYQILRLPCASGEDTIDAPSMTDLEWDIFVKETYRHRVAPLIYAAVGGQGLVPKRVEQSLQLGYHETLARNIVAFHALKQALAALAEAGIDVVLLKGAALVQSVYGNPALRPMDDLDLLVRHRDARRAITVLMEQGYERWSEELCPDYVVDFGDQVALSRDGRRISIDLSWYLLNPLSYHPQPSVEWFWASMSPVRIDSVQAWILKPEAQILHLCCHTWKHCLGNRGRLIWQNDIAQAITRYREALDWDELLQQAGQQGLLEAVWRTLGVVRQSWRLPLPTHVALWLDSPSPLPARWAGAGYRPVRRRRYSLAHVRGVRARIRASWCKLFPSREYMRARYGAGFWDLPKGYLTRLLQIVCWRGSLAGGIHSGDD